MTLAPVAAVEQELSRWDGYKEEPPGSNLTIFNRKYYGSNVKAAWCATFQSICFKEVGHTEFPQHAYTPNGAAAAKAKWGQVSPGSRLQKGDVIWFHWADMGRIAHLGWFSHYEGDVLRVWEGNTDGGGSRTGGQVMLQTRSRATIGENRGGIVVRVPYLDAPSTDPTLGDDMNTAYVVEIPPDKKGHMVPVPPPNAGDIPWSKVWVSYMSDFGGANIREAIIVNDVPKIKEFWVPRGRKVGHKLADGTEGISIINHGPEFLSVLVEARAK
jgi:hypothetical protein